MVYRIQQLCNFVEFTFQLKFCKTFKCKFLGCFVIDFCFFIKNIQPKVVSNLQESIKGGIEPAHVLLSCSQIQKKVYLTANTEAYRQQKAVFCLHLTVPIFQPCRLLKVSTDLFNILQRLHYFRSLIVCFFTHNLSKSKRTETTLEN